MSKMAHTFKWLIKKCFDCNVHILENTQQQSYTHMTNGIDTANQYRWLLVIFTHFNGLNAIRKCLFGVLPTG